MDSSASNAAIVGLTVVLAIAAVVQAAAAVFIWRANRSLAKTTERYAQVTADYARTAEAQYREAVLAREVGVRPYLHVPRVEPRPAGATLLANFRIAVPLTNIGLGPAFHIRWYLHDHRLRFSSSTSLEFVDVPAGTEREILIGPAVGIASGTNPEPVEDARLWVEYVDLVGHRWATAVKIRIGIVRRVDHDSPPDMWDCHWQDAFPLRDSQRVLGPLEKSYVDQLKLRTDDRGIPWPRDWSAAS